MPSPLAIMAVIAPSALLGALLFFFVYDEHSTKNDIQRDKHQLETMKFDRDFSNAWNGDSVTPPKENDIASMEEKIKMKEEKAKKKKKKENVELKKFRTTLSTQ
ncbi:hypothetical protein LNN94_27315 [Klebsiella pneumoniae subsp. pneumoniae]|nr:hypothetical protein [Klebsiella pneumoniae subsp. pneumoniae]